MTSAGAVELKAVDGLLVFPHVKVVDAPASVADTPVAGGMRAYKDSASSPLRGPTTEEMAAAPRSTSAVARRAAVDAPSGADAPVRTVASGAETVVLDESSLQYSVMVRQADGSLAEMCVTGADKADEIVRAEPGSIKTSQKEASHVR